MKAFQFPHGSARAIRSPSNHVIATIITGVNELSQMLGIRSGKEALP
mgnify:CR=1 FL=1